MNFWMFKLDLKKAEEPEIKLPTSVGSSKKQASYRKTSAATATAKSLQSCLTLCDPIDGSPPGAPVPGILQARTLEWVAISFSNAWKWSHSVVSNPQRSYGLQPTRLLHPWDFPGKSTGVGCHCLLHHFMEKMGKKWKQWQTVFLGSKITADGDCRHELKRHLLLGRKAVTSLTAY